MRLQNKYLKQQDQLMRSFEYELTRWSNRSGGHPIYERDGWAAMELSSTPRNEKAARARLLRDLRKRHPEHPLWRSMKKSRRRKGGRGEVHSPDRIARPLSGTEREQIRTGRRRAEIATPKCISCRRPWLSDLDYSIRPCPMCGGKITAQEAA